MCEFKNGDVVIYRNNKWSFVGFMPEGDCLLYDSITGDMPRVSVDDITISNEETENYKLWEEVLSLYESMMGNHVWDPVKDISDLYEIKKK